MKIELIKLELTNYRNIEHASLNFSGNLKIVGDNRIGKTNTLESIVWLLSDKLLNGSNDIASIKPLTNTKAEVRVEGTFLVGDKTIVLRKEYGEDWVKTRGSEEPTFKGHYLTYYYNGVKQKTQRDYLNLFKEDMGIKYDFGKIDIVRLLIDPFYIGELGEDKSWVDLRTFIISLIGDVSDDDVFAKDPTLNVLKYDLNLRSGRIEEVKKFYQNEIRGLQEQLIGDDAQIKMLEETKAPTEDEVKVSKKAIQELDGEIAKLQSEKGSASTMLNEIDKDIYSLKENIINIQKKQIENNPISAKQKELADANDEYRNALVIKNAFNDKLAYLSNQVKVDEDNLIRSRAKSEEIINEIKKLDEKIKNPEFDTICPTCGRPLEGQQLEDAKQKYLSSINAKRTELIESAKKLKESRTLIELKLNENKGLMVDMNSKLNEAVELVENILKKIESINNEIKQMQSEPLSLNNEELLNLESKISELEEKKRKVLADDNALNAALNEKIEDKVKAKVPYQKVVDDFAYAERQKETLKAIKQLNIDHSKQLASLEQKKELINVFIRTKLEMLDERVSTVFGKIKFQLIKENINGGFDSVCKPYIYDVEMDESTSVLWKSGSKSERVVTGIAIAECIKKKLDLPDLPFLFDEGGEISTDTFERRFKTDSQLICVKVVDNIKTPMVMKI